jgi:hypothetical protein
MCLNEEVNCAEPAPLVSVPWWRWWPIVAVPVVVFDVNVKKLFFFFTKTEVG